MATAAKNNNNYVPVWPGEGKPKHQSMCAKEKQKEKTINLLGGHCEIKQSSLPGSSARANNQPERKMNGKTKQQLTSGHCSKK